MSSFTINSRKSNDESKLSASPNSNPSMDIFKKLPKDLFPQDAEMTGDNVSDQEAFKKAFLKALEQAETKTSVDSTNTTTVTQQPAANLNAENLAKPFQENLYGDTLWTPALNRNDKRTLQPVSTSESVSTWEIETPYISR